MIAHTMTNRNELCCSFRISSRTRVPLVVLSGDIKQAKAAIEALIERRSRDAAQMGLVRASGALPKSRD